MDVKWTGCVRGQTVTHTKLEISKPESSSIPKRKGGSVQLPTDLVLRRYGSSREGKSVEKAEAPPSHTLHILHQEAASATRVTSKCADRL